jgi:multidrug efflux pump subunit AcrA (membrane-fusion protein)
VSDQEREAKKADYEGSEARLYAADAQVNLDKSKVDQYGALAEFKQVKAPFDGTITERKIDVGNLVTAGSSTTTTPLYRLAQTDPLRMFVDVPQSASGELMNAGAPAEIRATGAVGGVFLRKNRALRGIHQCAGAHHAGRGGHAQRQSRAGARHVRQYCLQAAASRVGRSARRRIVIFRASRNTGGSSRCKRQDPLRGCRDRPR